MSYVFYIKKEPDKGAFFPRSPRSPERLDHHFARCQKPSESMELNSSKLNFPIPFTSQLAQPSFSLMIIFSDYNLNWIKIALLSFGQKWSCFLDFSCATFSLWSKRHYRGTWFVSLDGSFLNWHRACLPYSLPMKYRAYIQVLYICYPYFRRKGSGAAVVIARLLCIVEGVCTVRSNDHF